MNITKDEAIRVLSRYDNEHYRPNTREAHRMGIAALNRVEELEKELADERHRHDRYVDFELAEAEELRKLKEERRWIPVTERLPNLVPCGAGSAYSEAVNVLTSGRKVLTAVWNGTRFLCDADYWEAWGEKITHWTPVLLPLPEAPC